MRKRLLLIPLLILLLAVAGFLLWPMLARSEPRPLQQSDAQLLLHVPADAGEVYLIPSAGSLYFQAERHPLMHERLEKKLDEGDFALLAMILGGADAALWPGGDEPVALVARLDPLRTFLGRTLFASILGGYGLEVEEGLLRPRDSVGAGIVSPELLSLGASLPAHLFILHLQGEGFPPLPRPALTAIEFTDVELVGRTRSTTGAALAGAAPGLAHAKEALISALVSSEPEFLEDVRRILPLRTENLFQKGGLLALYDLDASGLLPKLRLLFAFPSGATQPPEQLLDSVVPSIRGMENRTTRVIDGWTIHATDTLGLVAEAVEVEGGVALALDGSSLESYLRQEDSAQSAAVREWSVRLRPGPLFAAVSRVRKAPAYRLLDRSVRRKIDRLRAWEIYLAGAETVTIEKIQGPNDAEVQVRVSPAGAGAASSIE